MISFVHTTYRPAGIDLLVKSFVQADPVLDYELIVVDDLPGRVQRGIAEKFIKEQGVKLSWYGNSKPHPYAPIKCGLANAMNTGLIHARGDYVVFIHDYCLFPPAFISLWNHVAKDPKTLTSGVAIVYEGPEPTEVSDVFTWKGEMPHIAAKFPWVPLATDGGPAFECFYSGFNMSFFEETNGIDERTDHCICWIVSSMKAQAKLLGYKCRVNASALVAHMIDHREWTGGEETRIKGQDSTWRISSWKDTLDGEPVWQAVSPNTWNFQQARKDGVG